MAGRSERKRSHRGTSGEIGGTEQHRVRILDAAMHLLSTGGRDALTTRAVAERAHVQSPVLYRLYRDKASLLEAVAEYGFTLYLASKHDYGDSDIATDPAEVLRRGWRLHVHFGLAHPELYLLMYTNVPAKQPHPVAAQTHAKLVTFLAGVAAAGRLRFSVEEAAHLCHSAACGTVMTLLSTPAQERDLAHSELACEMVIETILRDIVPGSPSPLASALVILKAQLAESAGSQTAAESLSPAERNLLLEWLGRLSRSKSKFSA